MRKHPVLLLCALCFFLAATGFGPAAEGGASKKHKPVKKGVTPPPLDKEEPQGTSLLKLEIADFNGPCAGRVELRNLKGETLGAFAGLHWAWAEGSFILRVPVGSLNVRVTGGSRKCVWESQLNMNKDKTTEAVAALQTYGQVYRAGWVACDPFLQADAGAGGRRYFFGTLKEISIAARAEGVEVLGLAHADALLGPQSVPFRQMPEGKTALALACEAVTGGNFVPLAAEKVQLPENGGTLYTLGATTEADTPPDASLLAVGKRLQDRGGLVVLNHPTGSSGKTESELTHAAENTIFAVVAGLPFDAVDVGRGEGDLDFWFILLNQGFRVTALAGGPGLEEKKSLDIPATGCYLRIPSASLSPGEALESMKQGRVVVSNGPFIRLRIDEADCGGVISPGTAAREIFIEAISCSETGDSIGKVELLYNGEVQGQWKGDNLQKYMRVDLRKSLPHVGWLAARYYSVDRRLWALTNPVYVRAVNLPRPQPLAARLSISLEDSQTGKPVNGVIEVLEGETAITTVTVKGCAEFALPPTAKLRINAEGYNPLNWSYYRDGEARQLIEEWEQAGKLREALTDPEAYARMRKILAKSSARIRLQPVFLPE